MLVRRSFRRLPVRPRRLHAEQLEARIVLDQHGFLDVSLGAEHRDLLADGLSEVSEMFRYFENSLPFQEELQVVRDSVGNTIQFASQLDIPVAVANALQPTLDSLQNAAEITTDQVVAVLESGANVVRAVGGLVDDTLDEVQFDVQIAVQDTLNNLTMRVDRVANQLGVAIEDTLTSAQSVADATIDLTFGIFVEAGGQLSDAVNPERLFVLRDFGVRVGNRIAADVGDTVELAVGFLGGNGVVEQLTGNVERVVQLSTAVAGTVGGTTLEMINSVLPEQLLDIQTIENQFVAAFDIESQIGDWSPTSDPGFSLSGPLAGDTEPTVIATGGFAELENFTHIEPEKVLQAFDQFGATIANLAESPVLDIPVPFLKDSRFGRVLKLRDAYFDAIAPLRDATTNVATFATAQAVELVSIVGKSYDAATETLTYEIEMDMGPIVTPASVAWQGAAGALRQVVADAQSAVTSSSRLAFNLGFRLADEVVGAGQFVADRVRLTSNVVHESQQFAAEALYGMVGLAVGMASVVGDHDLQVDLINPNTGAATFGLTELNVGLANPTSLVPGGPTLSGASDFVLDNLAAVDDWLDLPSAASIIARIEDPVSVAINLVESNLGDLVNFKQFSLQDLADAFRDPEQLVSRLQSVITDELSFLRTRFEEMINQQVERLVSEVRETIEQLEDTYDELVSLQWLSALIDQDFDASLGGFDVSLITKYEANRQEVQTALELTYAFNHGTYKSSEGRSQAI
ncbi:MAG: hypothetical protein KDA60_20150, partial [Planctomycetales bacterium]|nr:hypothetical protein [Planctomycetales bacterium]